MLGYVKKEFSIKKATRKPIYRKKQKILYPPLVAGH